MWREISGTTRKAKNHSEVVVVVDEDDDEANLLTRCQLVASYWRSSNAHARAARVQYETLQV